MNKQSNSYSIVYIIVLAVIVGAALAITSGALSGRQQENVDKDKMRQILASIHIVEPADSIIPAYRKYVPLSFIVNSEGTTVEGNAFEVNVAQEYKKKESERLLPVFVGTIPGGEKKYILPVYGAGLWGPIWGYIAFNDDGATIYGAYFAHQGETPGLGAEIEKPAFSNQFVDKRIFKNGKFMPIAIVKAGTLPSAGEDYVDAVSGGTITSNGVAQMLQNCLSPYRAFLQSLNSSPVDNLNDSK